MYFNSHLCSKYKCCLHSKLQKQQQKQKQLQEQLNNKAKQSKLKGLLELIRKDKLP